MSGILPYIQKEALSCAHRRHRPRHFELGRSYLARLPGACVIASFPRENRLASCCKRSSVMLTLSYSDHHRGRYL